MKQLFCPIITYELNGYESTLICNINYGEVPNAETIVYNTVQEALNSEDFLKGEYFGIYKTIILHYGGQYIEISQRKFKSASRTIKYKIMDIDKYSMGQLMNKLPATEFVDWCHDNKIDVIIK